LLLWLAATTPLAAQQPGTGALRGTVAGTDGPIQAATVRLLSADRHASTDRLGEFRLDDVPPGEDTLEGTAGRFMAGRRVVGSVADSVVPIALTLGREAQRLQEVSVTAPRPAPRAVEALPDVLNGAIFAGKRTQVLALDSLDVNAAQNISRQVLG